MMVEIPKEWLIESDLLDFVPISKAYTSASSELISITNIRPPKRNEGVATFEKNRMEKIFKAIKDRAELPPIKIHEAPNDRRSEFQYEVRDGFHRFYVSIALGYSHIPIEIVPYFNIYEA